MPARLRHRLLIAAPILALVGLVLVIGVDAPRLDEWDIPGDVLRDQARGRLEAGALFKQHNESRKLIPKLIFLAAAPIIGWSPRAAMALTLLIHMALAALLLRALPDEDQRRAGPPLLLVLLLFHPLKADHFLSGLGLNGALVFLALLGSARWQLGRDGGRRLWPLGAALAAAASLCFASGLGLWILGLPLARLWLHPGGLNRRRLAIEAALYAILGALFFALYFGGYERPGHHPSWGAALAEPLRFFGFAAAWLGGPLVLGRSLIGAALCGLAQLLLLAFLLARALPRLRREPELRRALWPWLVVSAYALGSAAMVSLGRSPWGAGASLATRYFAQALWLPIGLLGLVRHLGVARPARPWLGRALTAALALSWLAGAPLLWDHAFSQRQARLTLSLIDAIPQDPMLARITPLPAEELRAHMADLRAAGIFTIPTPPLPRPAPSAEPAGHLFITAAADHWSLVGWGVNPRRGGPADFIVITRRSTGAPITALVPRRWRPDVARARRTWRAVLAGVAERFDSPPPGELEDLSAAAIDQETGEAFSIAISITITPERR